MFVPNPITQEEEKSLAQTARFGCGSNNLKQRVLWKQTKFAVLCSVDDGIL